MLQKPVDDGDAVVLVVLGGGEVVQIDLHPPVAVDDDGGAVAGADGPEDQADAGRDEVFRHEALQT
jgi:hypothetical protein